MVDPLSVTYGVGAAVAAFLAAYGLYSAGQRPSYMVDMREVASYYRHQASARALEQDVNDE